MGRFSFRVDDQSLRVHTGLAERLEHGHCHRHHLFFLYGYLTIGIQQVTNNFGIILLGQRQDTLKLRVRAKINLHFRRSDLGQIRVIRGG